MSSAAGHKERSRVLVIGGTGYIGRFIVAASAREGHPTYVLVRDPAPADPAKAAVLQGFRDAGVTLVKGDLYNHESLVVAMESADVVISAVGYAQLPDQTRIISAIKDAGNIKRFFPSEFGHDVDHVHAVEPAKSVFAAKASIRRAVEAEGIPYTYISSNFFAGRFLQAVGQIGVTGLPIDKVLILGDGNVKESPIPLNRALSISHSGWVKGDHTNFEIDPFFGVEATDLYPDVKYTTVDEYLNKFL